MRQFKSTPRPRRKCDPIKNRRDGRQRRRRQPLFESGCGACCEQDATAATERAEGPDSPDSGIGGHRQAVMHICSRAPQKTTPLLPHQLTLRSASFGVKQAKQAIFPAFGSLRNTKSEQTARESPFFSF